MIDSWRGWWSPWADAEAPSFHSAPAPPPLCPVTYTAVVETTPDQLVYSKGIVKINDCTYYILCILCACVWARERERQREGGGRDRLREWETHLKWRFNSLKHITLWSSKLCCIFSLEVNNEREVVPYIVFVGYVLVECHILVLKGTSTQSCNK